MVKHLINYISLLAAVLLLATCADNDTANNEEPLPEGMGRIRIAICAPEIAGGETTRAVNDNPWEDPDHEWEKLQTFRIFICKASNNEVVEIISGDKTQMTAVSGTSHPYKQSAEILSQPLEVGTYHIFATANFDDGYVVGSTIDPDRIIRFPNGLSVAGDYTQQQYDNLSESAKNVIPFGYWRNIPMTGSKLMKDDNSAIEVDNGGETNAGTITVWRVMGKLQFEFTNESATQIKILGIEVEPVNLATDDEDDSKDGPGIYLFSKDNLELTDNLEAGTTHASGKYGITLPDGARTDVGTVRYEPETALGLNASDGTNHGTGNLFFYVNETDATYTTNNNQLSLRFKIQRQKSDQTWYDDEIRYGVTIPYINGGTGGDGFNVIRRNDWIHIPIHITDWQLRIEPLAFVPIAAYPATTLSSDGLTATFSTGGMIALQPFVKKYTDNTWRDFSDPEVTFVSVSWKNDDGINFSGNDKIVKTAFAYDNVTHCLIGELNDNLSSGSHKTTLTVNVKLGPTGSQYDYSFTCNVVLQN